jgi:hypothetical protein
MTDFTLKRNDTSPAIEFQLQDDDGNAIDISGFNEVEFFFRQRRDSTTKVDDDTGGNVSVPDAANGIVKYEWMATDTETAGIFEAEFEVEYSDGAVETFPNTGYIKVQIVKDIA